MPFLFAAIVFLAVSLLVFAALSRFLFGRRAIDERLDDLKKERVSDLSIDTLKHQSPRWQKTAESVSAVMPMSPQTKLQFRKMLMYAGYRRPSALGIFIGVKIILSLGLFFLAFSYTLSFKHDLRLSVILGLLSFIIGLLLPNVWLRGRIKKRQTDIFHALPDVLDLLVVCVEAGLGLDASLIKITEERQFAEQAISQEFVIVTREIRAGKPRADALKDLGERTGVEDIKALTALLIQTDKLGASLARSLRVHSDSLRTKRRQIAEEAAAKTTIKLIFPLAFFIFPALFVVLLSPAVIRIYQSMIGKG